MFLSISFSNILIHFNADVSRDGSDGGSVRHEVAICIGAVSNWFYLVTVTNTKYTWLSPVHTFTFAVTCNGKSKPTVWSSVR